MKILAIETSCDETSAAILENGRHVLGHVIASQVALHDATGGVVPEVAAREHVVKIIPVVAEALKQAKLQLQDVDAIAVTQGPGLLSSLVIGVSAASTLALATNKTLIPVNHIAGHIYANWLERDLADDFPIVILTVSGGHNELVLMKGHAQFELIGATLDDAAGEAFDKVARLLGLGYPGGPHISRVAENGDAQCYDFPRAYLEKGSYDFSFSGLKTAVLQLVEKEYPNHNKALSEKFVADCAASFQEAVCEVLVEKLLRAARAYKAKQIHVAGGVSANRRLRALLQERAPAHLQILWPTNISYCTDNAAMIASAAHFYFQQSPKAYNQAAYPLADPNLRMY